MFTTFIIGCALGFLSRRRIKWPSCTLRLFSRHLVNSADAYALQHVPLESDIDDEPDIITMGIESGGFLPRSPPLSCLPAAFVRCEEALQEARWVIKTPGNAVTSDLERRTAAQWRASVTQVRHINSTRIRRAKRVDFMIVGTII